MAKQIVTLGIGAMDTLTPFITTGLEIGAQVANIGRGTLVPVPFRDKRAFITFRDKRAVVSGNN